MDLLDYIHYKILDFENMIYSNADSFIFDPMDWIDDFAWLGYWYDMQELLSKEV